MESFRKFFEHTQEQKKDIKKTLEKIPKEHRRLVKDYEIKWDTDNALDGEHVGIINPENMTITVAASFRYPREWVLLHEIGHAVWAASVKGTKLEEKWKNLVKSTKNKPKDVPEELFCHSYAQYYCSNKLKKFDFPEWGEFIKKLP